MSHLSRLSNEELIKRLERLLVDERASTLDIVQHLGEVERRRLHVNLGYDSLFSYCTEHLRYPASVAARVVQTARCARRFPDVLDRLRRGEVSPTTVAMVARVIDPANAREILDRIRNKSQREVELIAMHYRPASALRDRVRSVCVAVRRESPPRQTVQQALAQRTTQTSAEAPGSRSREGAEAEAPRKEPVPAVERDAHTAPRVTIERRAHIQFLAGREFMRKFEKVRALLSTRLPPYASFEDVLGAALDAFLDRHSPERRAARRGQRRAKVTAPRPARGRHIPVAVRDAVFARDGGRCTFVAPDGKRCGATHHLHVDHIRPFALGGGNTADNLRLLCANHNRLEAERRFGANIMRRFDLAQRERGDDD